ncbi:MAG: hypothetical protein JXB49_23630 [Bacteroidales bacterium]|nr:hypothetical protein [Bacteroidales bacterium]
MRLLVKKGILFFSPFLILFVSFTLMDVFKLYKKIDNYNDTFITLNRGYICYKTYLYYKDQVKFDSFIFGSSLSLSFKLENWIDYLPDGSVPFHFDGNGEGLYGIYSKIRFLDNKGDTIKNALIILDVRGLANDGLLNGKTHFSISPPEISHESKINFYWAFIKKGLDYRFILAYLDYSLFNTYRDYMGWYINKSKSEDYSNPINCDFTSGYEADIKKDSLAYYRRLLSKGVFYNRPVEAKESYDVSELEIKYLKSIYKIFQRHNTDFKIIIPPKYDQIPFDQDQLELLNRIFGQENVFNFSGKNKFSEPISNFFESDHYKPYVANEIMEIIYSDIYLP